MATHRPHPLNDHLTVERERIEAEFEKRLVVVYQETLDAIGLDASRRFQRAIWGRPIIAGADWQPPHPDEIYPSDAGDRLNRAVDKLRTELWQSVIHGLNVSVGLSLTLTNPLIGDAITRMGQKITMVTESQRSDIMQAVQDAYDQGLSIHNAAKSILAQTSISSKVRAQAIARTELTGATNLASLAAARTVNSAGGGGMLKSWVSANDTFVREAHADANDEYADNPIPVDQPFDVDGEPMMAPGDPNGSPGNVINCRCTVVYVQRDDSGGGYQAPFVLRRWRDGRLVGRRIRLS